MGDTLVDSFDGIFKDQGGGVFGTKVSQSGGDASLGWIGSPSQLGLVTISTDGTFNFGSRAAASPVWWQVGARGWDASGEVVLDEALTSDGDTLNHATNVSAFDQCADLTARRGAKAGLRSDFAYESSLGGESIGRIAAHAAPTVSTTRKALFGFTGRWNGQLKFVRSVDFTADTGTFDDGDNANYIIGEAFTGVKGGVSSPDPFQGSIIKYDAANSALTFITSGSTLGSTETDGAVITGSVSGATATLGTTLFEFPSAMKLWRADTDDGNTPTSPAVALAYTNSAIPQLILQTRTSSVGTDDDRPSTQQIEGADWINWHYAADWSGSDYKSKIYKDADTQSDTYTNPNTLDFSNVANDMETILFGSDWGGGTNTLGHLFANLKDPFMDFELARVVLGDDPIFANCTKIHVARSEAWSSTSMDVRLNYGEIPSASTTYAFIINNSDVCVNPTDGLDLGAAP